jgi:hypothetical protein
MLQEALLGICQFRLLTLRPPLAVVKAFFPEPYYEWWTIHNDAYNGISEALDFIRSYDLSHGPFDGVVGFSQGACLAAIICAQKAQDLEACPLRSVRFGVFFSGFIPVDSAYTSLFASQLSFPVFVSHGATDFKREESLKLGAIFENAVVLEHSGDHQLPRKSNGAHVISALQDFVSKVG